MSWVEVAIVAPLAILMATFVLRHDSTDAELERLRVSRERHKRANEMHQAEVSDLTDAIEDAIDSLENAIVCVPVTAALTRLREAIQ